MLADVATVGENFKRIRTLKKIKQEQIYKQLGFQRPSNVSLLETSSRLPKPQTIQKMAAVLECETWELLEDVETPWDAIRQPRVPDSDAATTVSTESRTRRKEVVGRPLATSSPGGSHRETDPVPGATRTADRGDVSGRVARDLIEAATVDRAPRPRRNRQPTAAPRRPAAGSRPPGPKRPR